MYPNDDGTVTVRGRLSPEQGALLMRALDAARDTLYQRPRSTPSATPDVQNVPAETSQRLACDAGRVVMRHDAEGQIVEIGARTRTIPSAIRRALHHRDRGCRFPGCGVRIGEGHHIRHWAHGGPPTLSNLAVLCRRHHRAVHEEGYRLERQADGALAFYPLETLRMANAAGGVHVDSQTIAPGWLGERLDVGWAIDVLHPRANPLESPQSPRGTSAGAERDSG